MFTASYYTFKGAGRVGISRGTPRGILGGYRKYAPLAPSDHVWETEDPAEYRKRYLAQLAKLDPTKVIADLQRLAGDCAIPTLLCFCDLRRPGAWCHRQFAAEWITDRTGLATIELSPAAVRKIKKTEQLSLGL